MTMISYQDCPVASVLSFFFLFLFFFLFFVFFLARPLPETRGSYTLRMI